jgi:hypothetical protein
MERSPMLMDWQNQYSENVYITKSNLHVLFNPHQNYNDISHRDEKSTQISFGNTKDLKYPKAALEISQYQTSNYTAET